MAKSYEITQINGYLGAVVEGLDLRTVNEEIAAELKADWLKHQVLFFPSQHLSPDELVDFGRQFYPLEKPHSGLQSHPDNPYVFLIKTDKGEGDGKDNENWHSDITFAPEPPIGSILQGVELPPIGGDTLFSSMYAAYERLSEPIKKAIEGLEAWHDGLPYFQTYVKHMGFDDADERIANMRVNFPGVAHPLVRTIPETGRRSLYIDRIFVQNIVGLSRRESRHMQALLCEAAEHTTFQVRWRWSAGDVAMWDNRSTLHFAAGDYGMSRRIMHRVTWIGERPVA